MYIKKSNFIIIIALCVVLSSALAFVATGTFYSYMLNRSAGNISLQNEIKNILKSQYYKEFDPEILDAGAAYGIAAVLGDPYTVYIPKDRFESMMVDLEGEYSGIGVYVTSSEDNKVMVLSAIEDTPAQKAGLVGGDKILKINGEELSGENLIEATAKIKSGRGNATFLIEKNDTKEQIEIVIAREKVTIQSVKSEVLSGSIGYIRITNFDRKTAGEFKTHLNELKRKKIKSLVLDLRDNPGGLVDSAVKIADELLPEGLVVYTQNKIGKQREYMSGDGELEIPMAVLINGNSASASEILSAAIKHYGKGVLIGETTFGKGLVQSVNQLRDGGALNVTIAGYFTPGGEDINEKGVTPDIEIVQSDKSVPASELDPKDDNQLQKAVEYLKTR